MNVYDTANRLAYEIQESDEYKTYKKIKNVSNTCGGFVGGLYCGKKFSERFSGEEIPGDRQLRRTGQQKDPCQGRAEEQENIYETSHREKRAENQRRQTDCLCAGHGGEGGGDPAPGKGFHRPGRQNAGVETGLF